MNQLNTKTELKKANKMVENLQTALLEFQKKIQVIKKDSKNPHFKNTYASLTQILSEVKPILSEVGIVLTQPILNGNVCTILQHGIELVESSIPLPVGLQPQPLGSAITYFRRYTLSSLLALEIDDDDAAMTSKPTPPLSVTAIQQIAITDKQFDAMLTSIAEGKKDAVKKALNKYTMNAEQEEIITKLLK